MAIYEGRSQLHCAQATLYTSYRCNSMLDPWYCFWNLYFFLKIFIYLISSCAGCSLLCRLFFSSCGKWGLLCSCGVRASLYDGFSCWGAQALKYLVALQHVGLSQIRDWTHVSCTGRWILHHWVTREAPRISASNPSFTSFKFRYCLSYKTFSCTHLLQLWTNLIARFSVLS